MKARFLLQLLAMVLCLAPQARAYISEPETIIYGRIINRSGAVDQLVTQGSLVWKLRKPDGSDLLLTASVDPLNGGTFSYSLAIPHQALSLGQETNPYVVGLATTATTQQLLQITYNGQPASIMAPTSSSFDLSQAQRGAAIRIDLEINIPMVDSDNDGIPDWWEMAHGMDQQSSGDALLDPDGDGRNNLAEYLANTDPNKDSRVPKLHTSEVVAYAESTSVVLLETLDIDSTASQLTYTVTGVPDSGALYLRNVQASPASPDRLIQTGSTFSQDDVNGGRFVYVHTEGTDSLTFSVRVADESSSHAAAEGEVRILIYQPVPNTTAANPKEALSLAAQRASSTSANGPIIADLSSLSGGHNLTVPSGKVTPENYVSSYVPAYGEDRPHQLFGGAGKDTLVGGMKGDVISGGPGDDQLSGKGGADVFAYTSRTDGNDTILDFSPHQGDRLDLTGLFHGQAGLLGNYVNITRSGPDALLGIQYNGSGTGYQDMVIRLANSPLMQSDLRGLFESGNLITDPIGMPPQVNITSGVSRTSENGPPFGTLVVSRGREDDAALSVALQISGSATNGVDYMLIPTTVEIPSGQSSASIDISPYMDALIEGEEIVQVFLVAQAGYEVGATATAQVVIEDLKSEVTIEQLNPIAEVSTQSPGAFLLSRTGILNTSLLVRLTIGGNATNGTDYNRIDNFFNLSPNQTSGVIQITPKTTASLQRGAEAVRISVKPDAAYRVGNPSMAEVVIVPEELSLDSWRATHFASNVQSMEIFAQSDPGGFGVPNLVRYGFGLNPTNPALGAGDLLPRPEMRNGHLTLCFRKSPAARDINYIVEVSDDLRAWRPSGNEVLDVSTLEPVVDPTSAVFKSVQPVNQTPTRYMRVRVVRTEP